MKGLSELHRNSYIRTLAPLYIATSIKDSVLHPSGTSSLYLGAPKTLEIYFMKVFILYRLCYSFAKSLILFRLLFILSGRRYSLQIIINNSKLIVIISNGFK